MRFILTKLSEPEIEPVTLDELKLHLRFDSDNTSQDALLSSLITVSRQWVEDYTGRVLVDQQWKLTIDGRYLYSYGNGDLVSGSPFPILPQGSHGDYLWWWGRRREIMLKKAPVISLVSFVTVDQFDNETDVDPATYALDEQNSKWPRIIPLSGALWTTMMTMRVVFRAGFCNTTDSPVQDTSVIPERFKQAMKLHCQALYDGDPKTMQLYLDTATNLIKPERSELQLG